MRAFWAVVRGSFKMWYRSKESVFWGVVFPILLMGLIGLVFGGQDSIQFSVAVVDQAQDELATGVRQALSGVEVFEVYEEEDEAEAMAALRDGQRSMVLVLRPIQGEQTVYEAYYDEGNAQVNQAGLAIIRQVLAEVSNVMTGMPDPVVLQASGINSRDLRMFDFLLPGVIAMTIMQTGLMGVTWTISSYRERKILKRVLATPVHPLAFLAGLVGRFTVVNLGQAALIAVVAVVGFGAVVVGSLWNLVVLSVIGSVTFLAMGFAISTVSSNAEAANALGSVINFPMLFLSGTFWPKGMLPEGIRPVIDALPLTPLVDAMRGVSVDGATLAAFVPGILYLLLWAAIGFGVAWWRFRWE